MVLLPIFEQSKVSILNVWVTALQLSIGINPKSAAAIVTLPEASSCAVIVVFSILEEGERSPLTHTR
ncbi:hypothetical protein AEQU3_02942 [Aequorivita antarctica]|nr:hypothetical protein AEQU3_02942 [Aequorivita antarctica]